MASDGPGNEGDSATGVFELLSDETRLRIVQELYQYRQERPEEPCLSFSALYARVDARDSGRFNYHLDRLRDVLVEKCEDGYTLTPLGALFGRLVGGDAPVPNAR